MEILFLKALREEGFCYELQQMSSLFSSDLHKFRLGTQLKTLTHTVDEKEIKINDTIIILSLSASQKLLVFEILKLVKLILPAPATNAVSGRSCSKLRRFGTYL